MAEDAEIRRANFRAWADSYCGERFSPTKVAALLGQSPQLWSDLYHGRKAFGEKIARKIEERADLVRMSLDDPDGPRPSPISHEVLDRLSGLRDEQRLMFENMLRGALGMPGRAAAPEAASRKVA